MEAEDPEKARQTLDQATLGEDADSVIGDADEVDESDQNTRLTEEDSNQSSPYKRTRREKLLSNNSDYFYSNQKREKFESTGLVSFVDMSDVDKRQQRNCF